MSSSSLSMITWNVLAQAYIRPDRYRGVPAEHLAAPARRVLLRRRLAALDADVILLQEVEPEVFAVAVEVLPQHDGHYLQRRGKPDGLALLVRRGALGVERLRALHYMATEPGYDHIAQVAVLSHGARRLLVGNTHLRWGAPEVPAEQHLGALQMRELLAALQAEAEAAEMAWVVAGDLNAGHDSPVLQRARAAGLVPSAASLRPWDTALINGRRRKLDYLLIQPERLRPTPTPLPMLSRHAPIPSATEPSDHLPLRVELTWC